MHSFGQAAFVLDFFDNDSEKKKRSKADEEDTQFTIGR